jgi:phosphoribosylglycinamide formyltransferase-1
VNERPASALRVGVLFSERTDLVDSLRDLAAVDPSVVVVATATDRHHDMSARPLDVPHQEFPTGGYRDRAERDLAIAEWLNAHRVDLVVTAGWLWLLSQEFLDCFPNRVINVHPTLLPAFPGRHSVEAAVAYGVRVHGVTVHVVDAGIDTGPILAQAASNFPDPTTAAAVRAALAPIEHQVLCEVVQAFAHRGIRRDAERSHPEGGS